MSYCDTADLVLHTGRSDVSTEILQELIDASDDEIDAYLAPYGLSGTASGPCRLASIELTKARLLDYDRQRGARADILTAGDMTEQMPIDRAIRDYRENAYRWLDRFVSVNGTDAHRRHAVAKVIGR